MKEQTVTFFVNPLVPAFLAGVAPFLGGFIAFRKDQIAHVFNPQGSMPDGAMLSGWGDLGICAVLLSVLVYGFAQHKRAEAITSKVRIEELGKRSEELKKLIETLPPQGFLRKYKDLLDVTYEFVASALEAKPNSSEDAIEAILSNLAHLTAYFDGIHGSSRYGVNVMVFEDFATIDSARSDYLFNEAKFKESGISKQALKGVLTTDRRYAFTLTQEIELDSSTPQLILPIPSHDQLKDHAGRTTVLPGAPEAFCNGEHRYCDDTAGLENLCRETGLRQEIAEKVDTYFKEYGQNIKSFLSLPISIPSDSGVKRVGIVNIHSNRKNMLRGTEGAELFVPLAAPYCYILAQIWRTQLAPRLDNFE
ncbi:MAG: hypothetical protein MRJ68_11865 [Nitrospira sp.]|nr:hypothetical protein [Nitrospira sp.]